MIRKRDPSVYYLDGLDAAKDAELGGIGLDWDLVPAGLADPAATLWAELAAVFTPTPTRFRESDRSLLARYCSVSALADLAERALFADGLLVPGRSESDANRPVKNPAHQLLRDYTMLQLSLARALALGPVARTRQGIRDLEAPDADEAWS